MKKLFFSFVFALCFLQASSASASGSTKTTIYVGSLEKTLETGEEKTYYSLGNTTVMRSTSLQGVSIVYLHNDWLGGTAFITDHNGQKKAQVTYYPYGKERGKLPTAITDQFYTGQRKDESSGLYFYNARYYNPKTGHFVSADKAQGPNRYAYAGNNPVTMSDPSGNQAELGNQAERFTEKPWFVDVEVIPEMETRFGVSFYHSRWERWTAQELWFLESLFSLLPENYYKGKSFYRFRGTNMGGSAPSEGVTIVGRSNAFIDEEVGNSLTYFLGNEPWRVRNSLEWVVTHELSHGAWHNYGGDLRQDFEEVMRRGFGISWIVLPKENLLDPEVQERMKERISVAASEGLTYLISNAYGHGVFVENAGYLISDYAMHLPNEALAEYGAYHLLCKVYRCDEFTSFAYPKYIFEELEERMSNLPYLPMVGGK